MSVGSTSGGGFAALRALTRDGLARRMDEPGAAAAGTEQLAPPAGDRCEMCAKPIGAEHSHVAQLDDRRLLCACRPCYLLFTNDGAGGGRYRSVPERYRYDPEFSLSEAQWELLGIPVNVVFFFAQTDLDQFVACYPSPGGATESLLELEPWSDVVRANPLLSDLTPDVEAALVRRGDTGMACYLTPIDACYELVGIVRRGWVGFDGGPEVWAAIDAFFDGVRARCRGIGGG